jgi:hypothetical protein
MVAGAGILDFFTADLLKGRRLHVLGLIGHGSRRVRVLGAPESWARPSTLATGPGGVGGSRDRTRGTRGIHPVVI